CGQDCIFTSAEWPANRRPGLGSEMRRPSLEAEVRSTTRRQQFGSPRKLKAQGRMRTNRLSKIVAIGNTARLRSVREPARHDEKLYFQIEISEDARGKLRAFFF